MTLADDSDTDAAPLRVEVLRGNPTDEELGALLAVVSTAYAEEAADALADDDRRPSAWSLSQRGLRRPFARERGWNNFPD
ncbi:hypothetical protein LK09_02225 [Microbacterium mangrovi]|uniref:Acyl-CoA carboxylase subunit epsilon n=1 Tax=Microbacterium mangrovi TaxID=1348253 RepID=A0A0B2A7J5_9MICO|nr:acyl-CoA carboxylase subunit epsilon [Microbacterium mangrovi]KHK99479.1 hypothetical protein LK09_02225 [Microbacterium mangrovi]